MNRRLLSVFCLFVFFSAMAGAGFASSWFNSSWDHRQKITIKTTLIGGNVTDNLAILVDANAENTDLWDNVLATGADVRFTGADGTTELDFNFEDWNSQAGVQRMRAWVKVTDTFTVASDIDIYIYYGNAAAGDGQDGTGVYDVNYIAVFHSNEQDLNMVDATSNDYDLQLAGGTPVYRDTGKIGFTIDFDGDYFLADFAFMDSDAEGTISAWLYYDGGDAYAISSNTAPPMWRLFMYNNTGHFTKAANDSYEMDTGVDFLTGVWRMVTWTWGGDGAKLYFDNDLVVKNASTAAMPATGAVVSVGARGDGVVAFDGKIDEIRFLDKQLDHNAISLLYWTDNNNSTFLTFGAEESQGGGGAAATLDVNLIAPNQGYFSDSINIQFSVLDSNNNDVFADLNYWQTPGGVLTAILNDFNVKDHANIGNLSCTGPDLTSGVDCNYSWAVSGVADGNYFVDLNAWEDLNTSNTDSDVSDFSFMIDNNAPWTTDDHNAGWQNFDANVSLSCSDGSGSGCANTYFSANLGEVTDNFNDSSIDANWTAFYETSTTFTVIERNNRLEFYYQRPGVGGFPDVNKLYYWNSLVGSSGEVKAKYIKIDSSNYDRKAVVGFYHDENNFIMFKSGWSTGVTSYSIVKVVDLVETTVCTGSNGGDIGTQYIKLVRSDNNFAAFTSSDDATYDIKCSGTANDSVFNGSLKGLMGLISGWVNNNGTVEMAFDDFNYSSGWTAGNNAFFNMDGNHELQYYSVDNADNNEAVKTVWVVIDTTAPAISSLIPADQSRVDSGSVSWDVNDVTSGVEDCNVLINGALSAVFDFGTHCTAGGNGYHCSYTETAFNYGENTLRADCNDVATNVVSQSNDFNYGFDPDVNVNAPNGGETWSGTQSIDFNVSHQSNHELHTRIAYSAGAGAFTNDLNADLNLNNYAVINGLNCDDSDWTDSTNCTYSWDTWGIPDGSYYIDINVWSHTSSLFNVDSSDASFDTDNEPAFDANFAWTVSGALDPENGVTTVTIDANASLYYHNCTPTIYYWDENGARISTDQNILWSDGNVGDRNFSITVRFDYDFNSDYWWDSNWQVLHINEYPQALDFNSASIMANYSQDFNATATDNGTIQTWFWDFNDGSYAYDQNTTHTFTATGDYNVCFEVQDDEDLNKIHCESVMVYGSLRVQFYDENFDTTIQPSVTVNGTSYSVNGSGVLLISLNGWATDTYTMLVWDANRQQRTFLLDLNQYSNEDFNVVLLDTDMGRWIEFEMYKPGGETLLPNARIRVTRNGKRVSEKDTNALAEIMFFLNPLDANYVMEIWAADGNFYTYYETTVTLKVPKREDQPSTTITPFEIIVGGFARQTDTNLMTDTNFFIFSNTTDYYSVTVGDWNASNYYDRRYRVRVLGGTAVYELQPYLIHVDTGLMTWLYCEDKFTRERIGQVLIIVQKNLSGVAWTTVESVLTDDTGSATVSWVINDDYQVRLYYGVEYLGTLSVRPNATEYIIDLDVISISYELPESMPVHITFTPSIGRIAANDQNQFHFDINVASVDGIMSSITITATYDTNTLINETYSAGVQYGAAFSYDLNDTNFPAYIALPLIVTVTVQTSRGTIIETMTYGLSSSAMHLWGSGAFSDIKAAIGVFGVAIISIFISFAAMAAVAKSGLETGTGGLAFIGGTALGFFVFIGWFSLPAFVVLAIGAVSMIYLNMRE